MNVQSILANSRQTSVQSEVLNGTAPDYQSFLKLLVEQMKNQDPSNPTSSTEMLSQLASFSSVEQQTETNARLDAISESLSVLQSSNLVGMTATSADVSVSGEIRAVSWQNGQPVATLDDGRSLAIDSNVTLSR